MNKSPFDHVIDRRTSNSLKWQKFEQGVIPVWVADMEFATPEAVTRSLAKRIEHPIFGYTSAPDSLIRCVYDYCLDKHLWKIETECLAWIPGVLPALTAACQIAGNPTTGTRATETNSNNSQDEIIVFPPVYHPLLEIPEKIGKTRVDVPLIHNKQSESDNTQSTWSIDFDSLKTAFNDNTVAILLSSPHNPMGVMFSEDDLFKVAKLCAENNVVLISDEIHCDLILSKSKRHVPTALAAKQYHASVITIMSPSKTFNLAGANCSFAHITDPALLKKFKAECTYTVPLVPTLSYTAAEAAYSEGWEWHSQLIEYLRANHDYLHSVINNSELLSMDKLDATYLAWIDTSRFMSDDANAFFAKAGIGLSPGSQFGNKNFQRLNFACSREQLEEVAKRMLNAVK